MKWLALSRVFRLGSILKVAVPVMLAMTAGAFLAGQQWQSGRQAQVALRVVQADQAEQARTQAHQHLEAAGYEGRRAERAATSRITDAQLRAFIDAHPDLWDCDIGPAGLRLIRSWSQAGVAADPAESFGPVSDPTAPAGHRPAAGSDGEHEDAR